MAVIDGKFTCLLLAIFIFQHCEAQATIPSSVGIQQPSIERSVISIRIPSHIEDGDETGLALYRQGVAATLHDFYGRSNETHKIVDVKCSSVNQSTELFSCVISWSYQNETRFRREVSLSLIDFLNKNLKGKIEEKANTTNTTVGLKDTIDNLKEDDVKQKASAPVRVTSTPTPQPTTSTTETTTHTTEPTTKTTETNTRTMGTNTRTSLTAETTTAAIEATTQTTEIITPTTPATESTTSTTETTTQTTETTTQTTETTTSTTETNTQTTVTTDRSLLPKAIGGGFGGLVGLLAIVVVVAVCLKKRYGGRNSKPKEADLPQMPVTLTNLTFDSAPPTSEVTATSSTPSTNEKLTEESPTHCGTLPKDPKSVDGPEVM